MFNLFSLELHKRNRFIKPYNKPLFHLRSLNGFNYFSSFYLVLKSTASCVHQSSRSISYRIKDLWQHAILMKYLDNTLFSESLYTLYRHYLVSFYGQRFSISCFVCYDINQNFKVETATLFYNLVKITSN